MYGENGRPDRRTLRGLNPSVDLATLPEHRLRARIAESAMLEELYEIPVEHKSEQLEGGEKALDITHLLQISERNAV